MPVKSVCHKAVKCGGGTPLPPTPGCMSRRNAWYCDVGYSTLTISPKKMPLEISRDIRIKLLYSSMNCRHGHRMATARGEERPKRNTY